MNDCPDGSDEDGCDAALCGPHRDGFLCRNRHCVTASARCDGVKDCGDFSDEETCMKVRIFNLVVQLFYCLRFYCCKIVDVRHNCRHSGLFDLRAFTRDRCRLWIAALSLAGGP